MIQLIPVTTSGTTPNLYGVVIDENLCGGYSTDNMPTVTVTAANNGQMASAGGVTMQKITMAITVVYQPCGQSSETKVKTYAETVTVALPGSSLTSITPSENQSAQVQATKLCCSGRANGVRIMTSMSVAFA